MIHFSYQMCHRKIKIHDDGEEKRIETLLLLRSLEIDMVKQYVAHAIRYS